MPNNNNNQNNSSPFGSRNSRSGSPFGSRNNNQTNDKDNAPQPDPNTYLTNTRTTVHREIVRFSLEGLGDPFYRVLGHQMNPDMGDLNKLAVALEAGGEATQALIDRLDTDWRSYDLTGAMLIFRFDQKQTKALAKPLPMPTPIVPDDDELEYLDIDDDDDDTTAAEKPSTATVQLRATDPALTLNVLARARSQVLLAEAPVVFGQEYLKRQIITDDPRLVAIARATGCLPDA